MGLRQIAEADLNAILGDSAFGFGYDVTLTDPLGASAPLVGFTNDIAQVIDADTGQIVSGRSASVALPIAAVLAVPMTLPRGIVDTASKPWLVVFDDINGASHTFKIAAADPDRAIGMVVCLLELYTP